jgi:hypothetical protein
MYYIVEITPRGSETFLEGFEDIGEAWDVVSRLQCEARRRRGRCATKFASALGRRGRTATSPVGVLQLAHLSRRPGNGRCDGPNRPAACAGVVFDHTTIRDLLSHGSV